MGFGKPKRKEDVTEFGEAASKDSTKGFKPSTGKELRRYRKHGRRHERERNEVKHSRKSRATAYRASLEELTKALNSDKPSSFKVYKPQFFEKIIELAKETGHKAPAYKEYLPRKQADADFLFELQGCLARMAWMQLSQLLAIGVNRPIPTRDYGQTFHAVLRLLIQAFGIKETNKGNRLIKDRDALDEWPIAARQRRSKSDKEDNMSIEQRNIAMQMASRKKDDDDDDDEDDDEDDDADDDDDDDDDDDEDDEDDKLSKKKKAKKKVVKKKKKSKDDDEDDEDDEDDDDDDDDDDDEDDDDDDDEDDDEDDDDDDEDDKPTRKKGKQMKKGKDKSSKKDKSAKSNGKKGKASEPAAGTNAAKALEMFGKKKGSNVEDVAKKLDTSVPNVRSLIGALRAKGHKIVNEGGGVFKI